MPPKDFVPPKIWARLEDGTVVELANDKTIPELTEMALMWDFQRVVRCKDCKYWIPGYITNEDDFIPPKCGKYFVSIGTEYEADVSSVELSKDNALGLDYSSPHFYVDSENNAADMPHFHRDAEKELVKEQRKLSKMKRGSNNYRKQKIRVAIAHERVRNCRKDWQHKKSTELANKYDYICVEGINYQDMARGLHLAKATNDNGFGQFRDMLSYKMAERGKKLITIDKWFPSSKMCRFCGAINSELTLKDREWECDCGAHLLRDHNAAINIREEGLRNVS